jgi:hypothetical protein
MSSVYKITNQKNGAICVGITQMPIQARWDELVEYSKDTQLARTTMPCLRIIVVIKKFGAENFTIEPLLEGNYSNEELEKLELQEIQKLNEAGITVYHRSGTFAPNQEYMDKDESIDDPGYFYG